MYRSTYIALFLSFFETALILRCSNLNKTDNIQHKIRTLPEYSPFFTCNANT